MARLGPPGPVGRACCTLAADASASKASFRRAGRRFPDLDVPVPTCGDQSLSIRTERQAADRPRVFAESQGLLPAIQLPHLDGLVGAPGNEALAVRAED